MLTRNQTDALLDKRVLLVENLDMNDVINHLLQSRIITQDQMEDVMTMRTRREKVERFLYLLERVKSEDTYQKFLSVLVDTGYDFIKDELEEAFHARTNPSLFMEKLEAGQEKDTSIDEVPQHVSYFLPRKRLLQKVEKKLLAEKYVVLAGIRGSGKTQIARYLVKWFQKEVQKGVGSTVRMEINAKDAQTLTHGLEYLTSSLNLGTKKIFSKNARSKAVNTLTRLITHLSSTSTYNGETKHILIFDDVGADSGEILTQALLESCCHNDRVYIIITTHNSFLYSDNQIEIKGFTPEETIEFFRSDSVPSSPFPESTEDIMRLGDLLSHLPLGIAVAKQYIKKRKQRVCTYIQHLMSSKTYKDVQKREQNVFKEGEYERGLMAALTLSIEQLEAQIPHELMKLYHAVAYVSHMRFPLDYLKVIFSTWTEEDMEMMIGDFVGAVAETSVGSITVDQHGTRMLGTHKVIQAAMRLRWNPDEVNAKLGYTLTVLSKLCNKDTRMEDELNRQLVLLPHVETAIAHAQKHDFSDIIVMVAEVRLIESTGHMYTQVSQLDTAQTYLARAIERFSHYFLQDRTDLTSPLDYEPKENDPILVERSKDIMKITESFAETGTPSTFVRCVLMKLRTAADVEVWTAAYNQRVGTTCHTHHTEMPLFKTKLSEASYELMVRHKIALDQHIIQMTFLLELFVTILHSHGRLCSFRTSKGQSINTSCKLTSKTFLILSLEICKRIKEKHGFSPLHISLSRHYGILYHFLRTQPGDMPMDDYISGVYDAKMTYEKALHDEAEYYQEGLLKSGGVDLTGKAICLRQLLRCSRLLMTHDTVHAEQHSSDGEKVLKQLMELVIPSRFEFSRHASFLIEAARFYHTRGHHGRDQGEVARAINLYREACELESKTGLVRYPWLIALDGLTSACLESDYPEMTLVALRQVQGFLRFIRKRSANYRFEWNKAQEMLLRVESMLHPFPSQSQHQQ